jgi:hypothetical protein
MPRNEIAVPPQESGEVWLNSFLLRREVELHELEDLPTASLDLIRAEALTLIEDPETRRPKRLVASYFEKLARIITERRIASEAE